MTISEKKMQIVIDNYFKSECDVNTSIRQAFEKGFRIGIKKLPSAQLDLSSYSDKLWRNAYERGRAEAQAEIIRCKNCKWFYEDKWCVKYMYALLPEDFCSRAERREDG